MIKLVEIYSQNKEMLRMQLNKANTPDESIRILKEYLSKLTDVKGDYISGLTRPQARIALDTISLFQYTYEKAVLSIGNPTTIHREEQSSSVHSEEQPSSVALVLNSDTLAGIGASSLVGVMLSNPFTGIPAAVVVGFGAAAVTHGVMSKRSRSNQNETPSVSNPLEYPHFDGSLVSNYLNELFQTVDALVEEYGRLEEAARPRPVTKKLEDHQKVLEFIQDLLGWYIRKREEIPEEALQPLRMRLEENLPDLLSEYNIQIQYYDPEAVNKEVAFFDFEKEVGTQKLQSPLVIRPALLKGDELLIKGRVIEPTTSPAQDNLSDHT